MNYTTFSLQAITSRKLLLALVHQTFMTLERILWHI